MYIQCTFVQLKWVDRYVSDNKCDCTAAMHICLSFGVSVLCSAWAYFELAFCCVKYHTLSFVATTLMGVTEVYVKYITEVYTCVAIVFFGLLGDFGSVA